ncbi:hypothetical protein NSQ51_01105 [Geobacillus sp. FSL K6-0789]|uniref:Uncharacterized protein n=2 Tax=Geobacillus stearothermophilus TaxID=1422 RepID=A0A0K9HKD7_GEOSE|nr:MULTISPECIES: hypothetical protein [Geobacillus]KMY59331.1 hypothetical protein AA904_10930 [Geobacillus stearothermophilus]KMY64587.1 hypothetical protein AA905_02835 [Geobacillus stearothermophilus]KQC47826.1 hypothetical protein AP057_05445 [Geobacillus sp. Sah69]KYD32299.1 hypothetical protein B4114_0187 [Geobacillus stearothermophilus]MED5078094.1 hypothetical protein [Geobacillus stearothermophilus]
MRPPQPLPVHARLEEVAFGGSLLRAVVDESGRLAGLLTKEQYLAAQAKASRLRLKQPEAMFNLTFRTLSTKIGRIFSFRCRMNP